MKYLESVLLAIISLGLVLKFFHLPFSSVLVIIGASALAILYFGLGRRIFPGTVPGERRAPLGILSGVALSILIIGSLFKIQIWPMGSFYLLISIPFLALLLIAVQVQRHSHPELRPYFNSLTKRLLPALVVGVLLYPVQQRTLLNFYYRDQPGKAELLDSLYSSHDPVVQERLRQEVDHLEAARSE